MSRTHSFGTGCAYEWGPTSLKVRMKLRKHGYRIGNIQINKCSEQLSTKLPVETQAILALVGARFCMLVDIYRLASAKLLPNLRN